MLEYILPYEKDLFFLINGTHSYFLDCMMWLFSGAIIWFPIAFFLVFSFVYKKRWTQWLPFLIAIALLFFICDQFSSGIVKPFFERPRPTHYLGIMEHVRTLYGYTGGQYGFISGHATNAFGFAIFTALLFRNRIYSIVIVTWAVMMSYSRIYLGVHFISDIVFGALCGIAIGYLVFNLYKTIIKKVFQLKGCDAIATYSEHQVTVIYVVIVSYIFLFSLFSEYLITFLSHIKVWL